MASFNLSNFLANPSSELNSISSASKKDLIELAKHLNLTIKSSMRKFEIRNLILRYFMQSGVVGEEASQFLEGDSEMTIDQRIELERLSVEKAKLANSSAELDKVKFEFEAEKERLELQAEKEKDRLKYEAELAIQVEQSKFNLMLRMEEEKARLHQSNKKQEIQLLEAHTSFDLAKNMKLVPSFTDYDPEDYFKLFEETAIHLNWPKAQWIWLLRAKLTGKAAKVCRHISDTSNYDEVKKAILDAFSISVEGYRQIFRNEVKQSYETYLEFANRKLRDFRKWTKSAGISSLDDLENLIVYEELKRKLPLPIKLHLEDRQEKSLLTAASLADSYSLIHKSVKRSEPTVQQFPLTATDIQIDKADISSGPLYCSYCKKEGHTIQNCKAPKCKFSNPNNNSFIHPSLKTS